MTTVTFRGTTYEIPESFTNRELLEIERIAGRGIGVMDSSYGSVFGGAWVALRRAGLDVSLDELLDLDSAEFDFEFAQASQNGSQAPLEAAPTPETPETSGSPV